MEGQLTVKLAELHGWADQVGRAGGDCAYLADYLTTFVPDGDFGPMLSSIRSDYELLSDRVREVLALDGGRLGETGSALHLSAASYSRTDTRVAQDLGVGAPITDVGRPSQGFDDTAASRPPAPVCGGEVLPTVTFGPLLDQANELMIRIGGPDIRSWVTDLIAGDIGKASAQASAWEHAGRAVAGVRDNLAHGSHRVARSWQGAAASSSGCYSAAWIDELDLQSDALFQVARHLRDAIDCALDVAQLVTDAVQEVIAIVAAGWTFASIPIFGQVQAIERLRDVLKLIWDAKKVLAVFWYFLLVLRDSFVGIAGWFTAESLPPAPRLPRELA